MTDHSEEAARGRHPTARGQGGGVVNDVVPRPKVKRRKSNTPMKTADALFGQIIRSRGACEVYGCVSVDLQCAHGFSRGYHAVRWDERNAFCLCCGHHLYFTHRPLEWEDWMRERIGDDLYGELRTLALTGSNPKLPEVVARLRDRARELEAA